ncbi:MAG: hypothetical protein LBQ88_05110 [Treponema sp.]|jgi:hypothetical protein|nr:hypothetical protein [Treponema sp.]
MKNVKIFVLAAVLFTACGFSVFAQAAPRSYYVRADGDDENNNGRSEEAPLKTLLKAIEMASKGAVKTITVLGVLELDDIRISVTGSHEILITGKANASDEEKAVLTGTAQYLFSVWDGSDIKIRLENIDVSGRGESAFRARGGNVIIGPGAKISGFYDGGVKVHGGIVTLAGGEISNNEGGGVVVVSGTFIMESGSITKNSASQGGGVWIFDGTTTTISGGTIQNNTAKEGGGIYDGGGITTISNGTISANNAEYGAGLYINNGQYANRNATLTITGGRITGNIAEFVGGGVYVASKSVFNQRGGTISGNEAGDGEGENIFRQQ